mmetsp:Transcript_18459/g.69945  ORF Transcript_18459/g.69945 Transcript_18459/m.69945 type:complete len:207 (-) Transcript_18459:694-1314(-)
MMSSRPDRAAEPAVSAASPPPRPAPLPPPPDPPPALLPTPQPIAVSPPAERPVGAETSAREPSAGPGRADTAPGSTSPSGRSAEGVAGETEAEASVRGCLAPVSVGCWSSTSERAARRGLRPRRPVSSERRRASAARGEKAAEPLPRRAPRPPKGSNVEVTGWWLVWRWGAAPGAVSVPVWGPWPRSADVRGEEVEGCDRSTNLLG